MNNPRTAPAAVPAKCFRKGLLSLFVGIFLSLGWSTTWAQNPYYFSVFAGTAGAEGSVDGTGSTARFSYPAGIAADAAGNLYVADANNHIIRKITSAGVVTTIAGTAGASGTTDGTGAAARFFAPSAIAVDGTGNLFVSDTYNRTIRKITSAGVVTTIAGTAGLSGSTDATGVAARFAGPYGIAVDAAGNLYVADTSNHAIRKIDTSNVVTTIAGTAGSSGATDGTGAAARFNQPYGLVLDGAGNLYVADTNNHLIRKIVLATGAVTTIAGAGVAGSVDSTGNLAYFNRPMAIALNGAGELIVTDYQSQLIRKVTIAGVVTTIGGTANAPGTTNGFSNAARFNGPSGVSVVGSTNLLIVDSFNFTIRKGSVAAAPSLTAQPSNTSVSAGTNATFSVAATGVPDVSYQWQRQAAGTVGFYALANTAPYSGANTATLTVTSVSAAQSGDQFRCFISNSIAPEVTSNAATLTVTQAPVFTSAASTSFTAGQTGNFVVTATGSPAPTLSVTGLPAGYTFDPATGLLSGSPGSPAGSPFTITFTASNGVAPNATQTFTLTVLPAPSAPTISAQPSNMTVGVGGSATFTVTASGNPAPVYVWQRIPAGGTLVNLADGGNYAGTTTATLTVVGVTAAMNGDRFQCYIYNNLGNATSSLATLTVPQAPVITSAATANFIVGVPASFTVTATGAPTPTFSATPGTLPTWASLDITTGAISGTPPNFTGSPFTVPITATNSAGAVTQNLVISVIPTPNIPTINTQPSNQVVNAGTTATFTVLAIGNPSPTYVWQRQAAGTTGFVSLADGGNYTGSATASLSVVGVNGTMQGDRFRCLVSNIYGTVITNEVTLGIPVAPAITSVATANFVAGQAGSFTFTASGMPAPTFSASGLPAWATLDSTTGILTGTPPSPTGSPFAITLTASNGVGVSSTQAFVLTVLPAYVAPTITSQPVNVSVGVTQAAVFSVVAGGNPAPSYQWQRAQAGIGVFVNLTEGSGFTGTTTATLTISSSTSAMNGDQFQCLVTNTYGTTVSAIASLSVSVESTISTLVGLPGFLGDANGSGTVARFNSPYGLVSDAAGNLYVADANNSIIRRVTPDGTVTTFAGVARTMGNSDGLGSAAHFALPYGITIDSTGNLYVADTFNHTVRMITPTGLVTTIAGQPGVSGYADGTGAAARFNAPYGIAADNFGNVFVADTGSHIIRKIAPGGVVTTLAGTAGAFGSLDGIGAAARFRQPIGMSCDAFGNVYVADTLNHAIRKISNVGLVSTVAGVLGSVGSTDGAVATAKLNQPIDVVVDATGNLYISDAGNFTIRKVVGGTISTLAGSAGSSGMADGVASAARFGLPTGLALTTAGTLYISDSTNHTIRRNGSVAAPTITAQPANRAVLVGQPASFTITVTGVPTPVLKWQRNPAAGTGFVDLTDSADYSGTSTAVLTVNLTTDAMNGDQFRCVVTNGVSPDAVSSPATLYIGTTPVFTSAASITWTAGQANTHQVTLTGTPAPTVTASGLPTWAAFDAATNVLSGTPPEDGVNTFLINLSASNTLSQTGTQILSLNVVPSKVAPTITTQPQGQVLNIGESANLTVVATGNPTPSYQWRRNGIQLAGATSATLRIENAVEDDAGVYDVAVINSAGTTMSQPASVVLYGPARITVQPKSQVVAVGGSTMFVVGVTGYPAPTYQWRKNGIVIAGATQPAISISNAQNADVGNYDVVVTNAAGSATSSIAQLTVVSSNQAPMITSQPASTTVVVGGTATFGVSATAVPAPSYQWRFNGTAIAGATQATYSITNVQMDKAGGYDVLVSNSAGSAISSAASLAVIRKSYEGIYFGSFPGTAGSFALGIRTDNTGVFLGFIPGSNTGLASLNVRVSDTGEFSLSTTTTASQDEARPAMTANIDIVGTISANGTLTGTINGGGASTLSGSKAADSGIARAAAGFYQAGIVNSSSTMWCLAAPSGQAYVLTQVGSSFDGGLGAVDNNGRITVATAKSATVTGNVNTTAQTFSASVISSAGQTAIYNGADDDVIATQRLANISTRARVGTTENVAIAGFIISGTDSKTVLIRAVGPTLSGFGVAGTLAAPVLELKRGNTVVASNAGWTTASNTAAIAAAANSVGAFSLNAGSADSVILTTLAPGSYTATVSGSNNTSGVALVEVYDLSAPAKGQKVVNISTRAVASSGENALIAGVVVSGASPKRLLIRAVGPGLANYGVSGVLSQPQLTLYKGSQVIAQNAGWSASADAASIAATSTVVGAFPLNQGSADAALLLNLEPGAYTAMVTGPGTASGICLVEVYEVP